MGMNLETVISAISPVAGRETPAAQQLPLSPLSPLSIPVVSRESTVMAPLSLGWGRAKNPPVSKIAKKHGGDSGDVRNGCRTAAFLCRYLPGTRREDSGKKVVK